MGKYDLKSIAVRFDTLEERKSIEDIFITNGFGIWKGIRFNNGHFGIGADEYTGMSLTNNFIKEYKNKITFKEFMEDNKIMKLDIKKDYKDDKIHIINNSEYTTIKLSSNIDNRTNIDLRFGKKYYSTTLEQINAIILLMGLDYELISVVDWENVSVGTKIKITTDNIEYTAAFHSYVPYLNKVIVIHGEEIKAILDTYCEVL